MKPILRHVLLVLLASAPFTAAAQPADSVSVSWEKPAPNRTTYRAEGITCGPVGAGGDTLTNLRKDRTDVPSRYHPVTFQAITRLPMPSAPISRLRWTQKQLRQIAPFEGTAVTLTGFLDSLKVQGPERCNCRMTQEADVDWHLWITAHRGESKKDAIVTETTPRVRKNHPGWTTAALIPFIQAPEQVRLSGWLMYDPDHPEQLGNHRITLWEIHPVTKIEVFKAGAWVDLDPGLAHLQHRRNRRGA